MRTNKKTRRFVTVLAITLIMSMLSGCSALESKFQDLKGDLLGASYNIEFFDNYGAKFLNVTGKRISMEGNYTYTEDSEGNRVADLTSVVTITIDGHNMETTGSTVIFADEHLEKLEDFSVNEINSTSDGITSLTSISRNVNALKNLVGTSKVVLIQSQMGVPICAYGGDDVYWEIPDDLPKTTKLMISVGDDSYPLYIHRANYQIIDTDLL